MFVRVAPRKSKGPPCAEFARWRKWAQGRRFLGDFAMTYHELFGFMSPELSKRILDETYTDDKPLYKLTLAAVADAKKLRPQFYEKKPRAERDTDMISMLSRPRL